MPLVAPAGPAKVVRGCVWALSPLFSSPWPYQATSMDGEHSVLGDDVGVCFTELHSRTRFLFLHPSEVALVCYAAADAVATTVRVSCIRKAPHK